MNVNPHFAAMAERESGFPVVQAHQRFVRELAKAAEDAERDINRGVFVGFLIGMGFGAFLLAIIRAASGMPA